MVRKFDFIALGGGAIGAVFVLLAAFDGTPVIDTANATIGIGFAVAGHVIARALSRLFGP
ncbi:MAG: hypothetical protein WD969_14620 [Paracoccaceae bacterium]